MFGLDNLKEREKKPVNQSTHLLACGSYQSYVSSHNDHLQVDKNNCIERSLYRNKIKKKKKN